MAAPPSPPQVLVDDYLRTSVPSIWALGDVINRIQVGHGGPRPQAQHGGDT